LRSSFQIIAHRGASAAEPENSLAAFRRAVAMGADGIELDVHLTADGALLVLHDDVIGGRPVAGISLRDARVGRLPNGECIPTLPEALQAIGPDTDVYVEVKALSPAGDAALLDTLAAAPAPGRCHVHSFDHRIVRRLREREPRLVTGVLSTSYPVDPLTPLVNAGAAELWQHDSMVDRDLVQAVHGAGARLLVWTVDDAARLRWLRDQGVDGVCTNRPDAAREALR
jgi:glycerophosphoryl diester phosphodiesterase